MIAGLAGASLRCAKLRRGFKRQQLKLERLLSLLNHLHRRLQTLRSTRNPS